MIDQAPASELLSKAVFGTSHMLAVIVEISKAQSGEFSIPQLAASTGLPASTVHYQLKRLKAAKLVKQDRRMEDRTVVFKRRDVPFWGLALLDPSELDRSW